MVNKTRILELLMELGYGTVANFEDLELEGILEWLENEKLAHVEDLRKIAEAMELIEEYRKEQDESFVKIKCPYCSGAGYIQSDKHKSLCPICHGRTFIWAEKVE